MEKISIEFEKPKRKILINPGPATTSDTVKYAQIVSDICHLKASPSIRSASKHHYR